LPAYISAPGSVNTAGRAKACKRASAFMVPSMCKFYQCYHSNARVHAVRNDRKRSPPGADARESNVRKSTRAVIKTARLTFRTVEEF